MTKAQLVAYLKREYAAGGQRRTRALAIAKRVQAALQAQAHRSPPPMPPTVLPPPPIVSAAASVIPYGSQVLGAVESAAQVLGVGGAFRVNTLDDLQKAIANMRLVDASKVPQIIAGWNAQHPDQHVDPSGNPEGPTTQVIPMFRQVLPSPTIPISGAGRFTGSLVTP